MRSERKKGNERDRIEFELLCVRRPFAAVSSQLPMLDLRIHLFIKVYVGVHVRTVGEQQEQTSRNLERTIW